MKPAAVYFGETLGRYGFGQGHPFGPDRIDAFWKETVKQGLDKHVRVKAPVLCEEKALGRFHTRDYIDRVKYASINGSGFLDAGDTPAFTGIYEAARYVVGSDLEALEGIVSGETPKVFVPIAGLHHGRRDSAAGFCAFNDIGIVIQTLRNHFGIKKIAYIDIDAHHGDGVFYEFEEDPNLIFADIHEDGRYLYPGTGFSNEQGKGKAEGTKLNIPLLPDCDDTNFHQVWPQVEAFVKQFSPEIILFQAGADSIDGDPITHMRFSPSAHGHAAASLVKIANEYCDGRMLAMGGGGYNRTNLALGWNEVVAAMVA